MNLHKIVLVMTAVVAVVVATVPETSENPFAALIFYKLSFDRINSFDKIWKLIWDEPNKPILEEMKVMNQRLNEIQLQIKQESLFVVQSLQKFIKLHDKLRSKLDEITRLKTEIESRANTFKAVTTMSDSEIKSFLSSAEGQFDANNGVSNLIIKIKNNFAGDEGVLYHLQKYYQELPEEVCDLGRSVQQHMFNTGVDVILHQLQAFFIGTISFTLLSQHRKDQSYEFQINKLCETLNSSVNTIYNELNEAMKFASQEVWRCHPSGGHQRGITFDEVTRLLQGVVINEREAKSNCYTEDCSKYDSIKNAFTCLHEDCKDDICSGKAYKCRNLVKGSEYCLMPSTSSRTLDYIQFKDFGKYGSQSCSGEIMPVKGLTECEECFCICTEQRQSEIYFNLREYKSDKDRNMVVTGVRFRKHNGVFHLQIQEGRLEAYGTINTESIHWVDLHDYKISDSNVKEKVDYHKITYEQRIIDLDKLITPDPSHVITGVRFIVHKGHLKMEVHISRFEFETAEFVYADCNIWKGHNGRRIQIHVANEDLPTKTKVEASRTISENAYVEFTHSSIEMDAAQSTIPFIEVQDVASIDPIPLAGVGLFYKTSVGSGGFIAPSVYTYNIGSQMIMIYNKLS